MSNVQLVIFDCDGVLVDSEPIANRAFADMIGELGLKLSDEQLFTNFVGYSMAHCMRVLEDMLGRAPPADFLPQLQERTFAAFRTGLQSVPGIHHALDQLAVPYCVASSGEHEKMQVTLGLTGLWQRFEGRIFSATEVPRGKPAPDIYLHAASRCGAVPEACIVIEDSPPGVMAGVAAGMTVLGFSARTSAEKLAAAGARTVFDDMTKLPLLLSRHGAVEP